MNPSDFLDKNGLPSSRKLADPEIANRLSAITHWMKPSSANAERLYAIHNNLSEYPKLCKFCKTNPVKWSSWTAGYDGDFCSRTCFYSWRKTQPKKVKVRTLLSKEEKCQRQISSNRERYGKDWPWMISEIKEKKAKSNALSLAQDWLASLDKDGYTPLFDAAEYKNSRAWLPVSCKKCNTEFSIQRCRWTANKNQCPTCWTKNASIGQHELADWIKSLSINVRLNDRKVFKGKFELDIYAEEKNLVIEYDGLYWHSEKGRADIKHKSYEKFLALKNAGLKHIMVFDTEWENKKEIVKSRIKNALGIIDTKIPARKCQIVEVSAKQQFQFFEDNHTQGGVNCEHALGLQYGAELVAVMTFGKCRFSDNFKHELLRFATKTDTSVVGAASKLFAHWRKTNQGSIISFSDNRWGTGSFYTNLGFIEDGQTGQGYFYTTSNGVIRSRQQMMKHKLVKTFGVKFDDKLSERENCWNNGWYRVWNLGNTRWTIK